MRLPQALGLAFFAGLGCTMAMAPKVARAREGAGPDDYVLAAGRTGNSAAKDRSERALRILLRIIRDGQVLQPISAHRQSQASADTRSQFLSFFGAESGTT